MVGQNILHLDHSDPGSIFFDQSAKVIQMSNACHAVSIGQEKLNLDLSNNSRLNNWTLGEHDQQVTLTFLITFAILRFGVELLNMASFK